VAARAGEPDPLRGRRSGPLVDLGEELFRNPPVTFCKKIRVYFHPLCPRCKGPLRDCRDDSLLRDHGLAEYSRSVQRYCIAPLAR